MPKTAVEVEIETIKERANECRANHDKNDEHSEKLFEEIFDRLGAAEKVILKYETVISIAKWVLGIVSLEAIIFGLKLAKENIQWLVK